MTGGGVIQGGWGFVWAAYGATAAILIGYAVTVILRLRAERRREDRAARE